MNCSIVVVALFCYGHHVIHSFSNEVQLVSLYMGFLRVDVNLILVICVVCCALREDKNFCFSCGKICNFPVRKEVGNILFS